MFPQKVAFQIASFQRNRLAGADLSFGHLVRLTLLPVLFFFLLGVHKRCCVRATTGCNLPELPVKIKIAVAVVTLDLFHVWTEIEYRYDNDICRAIHGTLTEYL
jgi:hypothetical protein